MPEPVIMPVADLTDPPVWLTRDVPAETIEALAGLPEYPRSTPIGDDVWRRMTRAAALIHPSTAEFSYATSLIWGGGREIRLARIDGVVTIEFTDMPRHATLVPLPGTTMTRSTVRRVAAFLHDHQVRLLTSTAVALLAPAIEEAGLVAVEQPDDSDYLYAIDTLAELAGPGLAKRRKEASRFERRWGASATLRVGRMEEPWAHRHLLEVHDRWIEGRKQSGRPLDAEVVCEAAGIMAWPISGLAAEPMVFALSVGDRPAGVSVIERTWGGVHMGIVMKTDLAAYEGVTPYLRREVCRHLRDHGGPGGILNVQQTAGVAALARMKSSYRPIRMEPKFSILPAPASADRPGVTCSS